MARSALADVLEETVDQAIEFVPNNESPRAASPFSASLNQSYDFVFKFLLVGDSDVGKEEILEKLDDDGEENSENYRSLDVAYKSTSILLYGKRVSLHIWFVFGDLCLLQIIFAP